MGLLDLHVTHEPNFVKYKLTTNTYKFQSHASNISTYAKLMALKLKFLDLPPAIFISFVRSSLNYIAQSNYNFVTMLTFMSAPRKTK